MIKLEDDGGKRLLDLASRPVQLKMLMDVLPSYNGDVDNLTVAMLYYEFVDLVLRREAEKASRSSFPIEKRRQFVRSLAYWMWSNDMGSEVDARKLPVDLFKPFLSDNDPEAMRRDLPSREAKINAAAYRRQERDDRPGQRSSDLQSRSLSLP